MTSAHETAHNEGRDAGIAGRRPFAERYHKALGDSDVRGGLIPFQESWREVRDARIAEVEEIAGEQFETLRRQLAGAKDTVRADYRGYVDQFRAAAEAAGAVVYEASTIEDANEYIANLCRERGVEVMVKGKSMVSEEIFLNEHLAEAGVRCVETDLGEWLIQLDEDHPSHIVIPAIHMRRHRAATLLSEATGVDLDPEDIPAMVGVVRDGLRRDFLAAGAGLTGANALIAESGTLMIVTNEGNQGLSSTLPPLHIVTASMDKILPTFEDAMRQVRLLARSATGQSITTYTSFITGPMPGRELHIVLVDNGRSEMAAQPDVAEALRCIRCGACANVCPAYAIVGGHAFGHVYSGAIGLITTAFHHGLDATAGPQSLCVSCGACATVCPVEIPLPEQILAVRRRVHESGRTPRLQRLALRAFASRRLVGAGARIAALGALPFRRGAFTRLPWLPAKLRWRTPPALPLRPARSRPELRASTAEAPSSGAPASPRVSLLIQCVTDRLLPQVAVDTATVLRRTGAQVDVPQDQHCCGLPAFDGGDWETARRMARATIEAFESNDNVVTPAPSCAAMIRHDYEELFKDEPQWLERARALAGRTYDLASYLEGTGSLTDATNSAPDGDRAVAVHHFCQSAARLKAGDRVDRLLQGCGADTRAVEGGVCCGFGGQTSMVAPEMSQQILRRKLAAAQDTGAPVLVTDNPGCLLHMRGGADAAGSSLRVVHLAEYLARWLPGRGD